MAGAESSQPQAVDIASSTASARARVQLGARLQGVLGAALIVMGGFVASKLLGLIRNIVIQRSIRKRGPPWETSSDPLQL